MLEPVDQSVEILQAEITALRLANQALGKQLLAEAKHTDAMLSEGELQRNALREANNTQQHLSSFIQRVMDSAGSLLIVLAPDGRVRMSNQRCEEALGIKSQQLAGTVLDDLLPADERSALAAQLPALPWQIHSPLFEWINHQDNYSAEHHLLSGDGSYRSYLLEAAALYSPQGKPEGAVVNATDITGLKDQEARLRRSESLLKEAQRYALMGSWELDLAHKKLSWSDEAYHIFEIDTTATSDPYHDFFSAIHPEDRARVDQAFATSLRRHKSLDVVHRLLITGQHLKWVHQRGIHQYAENGRPLRSVGTVQDITERYLTEQQQRIAATAFESQEGMVITAADMTILRVNRSFSEITGYSAAEVVGHTPRLLNSGRHDAHYYAAMWACINETGAWQGEIWNRRKNGEIYPERLTITAVKDDAGAVTHYVGTMTDITLRKVAEDEIRNLAFYDPLTRLPNRRLLMDRLQHAIATSARTGRDGALLFIDLDNFKSLNDTLGHDKGDLLLQQVAQRLTNCVRESDTVARLGGDEFVVMLEDLSEKHQEAAAQTEIVGEKILASLNASYLLAGHDHHSTPSIGATQFSGHQNSVEDLLKQADLAMYQAKSAGRNALRFFDPEMQSVISQRVSLEADLRQGVHNNEFVIFYQPQVNDEGALTGAEALIRWQHPERGLVPPNEFIPLAEENGLIVPLGRWVLDAACAQLAAWARQQHTDQLSLAVNVSARQFRHPDFVDQVLEILARHNTNPQRLKLELTESMLDDNVEEIITKMSALKAHGESFSLDDFGTGFSSLSYLKRLPLDQLKIDRSFVRDMLTETDGGAIVQAIIALGQTMGLSVIAEGVETEAQRNFLDRLGCHNFQGYLFGQPLPLGDFERLASRNVLAACRT
jgi:diguanylate cyclase (GGDEF)-like protein/PAS domain S-box-containing protein